MMSALKIFAGKRVSAVKRKQSFSVCFLRVAEKNDGAIVKNDLENRRCFVNASVDVVAACAGGAGVLQVKKEAKKSVFRLTFAPTITTTTWIFSSSFSSVKRMFSTLSV